MARERHYRNRSQGNVDGAQFDFTFTFKICREMQAALERPVAEILWLKFVAYQRAA
jgi:hypothetical protein